MHVETRYLGRWGNLLSLVKHNAKVNCVDKIQDKLRYIQEQGNTKIYTKKDKKTHKWNSKLENPRGGGFPRLLEEESMTFPWWDKNTVG